MENKPVKLTTIEELDTFFKEKGISSEKTRFFINENRSDPKCFGIYKEGDEYIVYKNKANGQRFTRYKGNNESIAVNIFFSKLVDEMDLRTGLKKEKEKKTMRKYKNMIISELNRLIDRSCLVEEKKLEIITDMKNTISNIYNNLEEQDSNLENFVSYLKIAEFLGREPNED